LPITLGYRRLGRLGWQSSPHLTDTDLERYYLGMVTDGAELATLEEHLLVCPACVDRAEASDAYVDVVRAAATLLDD